MDRTTRQKIKKDLRHGIKQLDVTSMYRALQSAAPEYMHLYKGMWGILQNYHRLDPETSFSRYKILQIMPRTQQHEVEYK